MAVVLLHAVIGLICAGSVAALAARLGALTPSGAVSAVAVGTVIFAAGGLTWSAILMVFFGTSSLLSARLRDPTESRGVVEKGGARDALQVLANGGIPAIYAALSLAHASPLWAVGFSSAVAVATADTWATEIGSQSATRPRRITTGEPVIPGTSGGVTPLGLAASLGGSILIATVGIVTRSIHPGAWAATVAGGFAGGLIDSLLGATLQEIRWCPTCLLPTEQRIHRICGSTTGVVGGWPGFNNDAVNLASGVAGSFIGVLLFAAQGSG